MKKQKLSIRGKIGIVPSLFLTIPLFAFILVFGVALWLIAKTFKFLGITEAIQYQLRTFDNGILKGKRFKPAKVENELKSTIYETE